MSALQENNPGKIGALLKWLFKGRTSNVVTEKQQRKRKREAENDDENATGSKKRPKKSPTDALTCPITLELMWDPVAAEDKRVYEKDVIEKHSETQRINGGIIKSPISNKVMGERLVPLPQLRSLIETMIETGAIQGDLASAWNDRKTKQANELQEREQKAKANRGDILTLYKLGRKYSKEKNHDLAMKWFFEAYEKGCVKSTAHIGWHYCLGEGVPKCEKRGYTYLTMAATQGSDLAACILGMLFGCEIDTDIARNEKEAIKWLQKSLSPDCPVRHMPRAGVAEAKAKLRELLNTGNSTDNSIGDGPNADANH